MKEKTISFATQQTRFEQLHLFYGNQYILDLDWLFINFQLHLFFFFWRKYKIQNDSLMVKSCLLFLIVISNRQISNGKKRPRKLITYNCIILARGLELFFFAKADIVLNLFINFDKNLASYSKKTALLRKKKQKKNSV